MHLKSAPVYKVQIVYINVCVVDRRSNIHSFVRLKRGSKDSSILALIVLRKFTLLLNYLLFQIALLFAFFQFYICALILPSLFGMLFFIGGTATDVHDFIK